MAKEKGMERLVDEGWLEKWILHESGIVYDISKYFHSITMRKCLEGLGDPATLLTL